MYFPPMVQAQVVLAPTLYKDHHQRSKVILIFPPSWNQLSRLPPDFASTGNLRSFLLAVKPPDATSGSLRTCAPAFALQQFATASYTRGHQFCPIESQRYIDFRSSAICLYIKIDMRIKFDGTESESAGVPRYRTRHAAPLLPNF